MVGNGNIQIQWMDDGTDVRTRVRHDGGRPAVPSVGNTDGTGIFISGKNVMKFQSMSDIHLKILPAKITAISPGPKLIDNKWTLSDGSIRMWTQEHCQTRTRNDFAQLLKQLVTNYWFELNGLSKPSCFTVSGQNVITSHDCLETRGLAA